MFNGSLVALVTPMQEDGSIDYAAVESLIDWHIKAQTAGIVVAGTTGESPTLTKQEHLELLSFVVKKVANRVPIIAGTGTNATESSISLVKNAELAGADGCLIVTPYYNKPTQEGMYAHYKKIAETTSLPIILYNVPGRTGCDLLPTTIAKLAKLPNIVGIKEATGDIERSIEILQMCGNDFLVLSGDDAIALSLMRAGAKGVISVTANVAPLQMQSMCKAALTGDYAKAEEINTKLMGLHENLFLQSNPIPTKWALTAMNKIKPGIRLPLLTLDKEYHDKVKEALLHAGVL